MIHLGLFIAAYYRGLLGLPIYTVDFGKSFQQPHVSSILQPCFILYTEKTLLPAYANNSDFF